VLDSVSANFPVSPKKFWRIGTVGMVLQRFDSIKKTVRWNSKEEKPVHASSQC